MTIPKLQVLGPDGVSRIDRAAREILRRTGVLVPHERMLTLLDRAGASVESIFRTLRRSIVGRDVSGKTVGPLCLACSDALDQLGLVEPAP